MAKAKYLIVDSREKSKAIKGILAHFDRVGIPWEVHKLRAGDYMDYNHPELIIDRKQNIAELAKNCTAEHERFRRELDRVKAVGAHLVILVEQNRYKDRDEWVPVAKISDLIRWSSPHTVVRGERIYRILVSWTAKYPLTVVFCDKRSTGKIIEQILYNGRFLPSEED